MQIFIEQLNGTNHVNYSKAYLLFKERTGFPFSDPKHMRKRMDQIVYTFKTQGDMLPEDVKRKITEYNEALEAAKQRDSSNRKRLILMEPVEADDTRSRSGSGSASDGVSDGEADVEPQARGIARGIPNSNNLLGLGSKKNNGSSMSPTGLTMGMTMPMGVTKSNSNSKSRKRKHGNGFSAEESSDRTLKRLAENVERLTRMMQSHDLLLNRIVRLLEGNSAVAALDHHSNNGGAGQEESEPSETHTTTTTAGTPAVVVPDTASSAAAAAAAAAAASNVLNPNPSLAAANAVSSNEYDEEDGSGSGSERDHVTIR